MHSPHSPMRLILQLDNNDLLTESIIRYNINCFSRHRQVIAFHKKRKPVATEKPFSRFTPCLLVSTSSRNVLVNCLSNLLCFYKRRIVYYLLVILNIFITQTIKYVEYLLTHGFSNFTACQHNQKYNQAIFKRIHNSEYQ